MVLLKQLSKTSSENRSAYLLDALRQNLRAAEFGYHKSLPTLKRAGILFLVFSMLGCNSLFFYPSRQEFFDPKKVGLAYEDVYFLERNGKKLHGWWLPAIGAAKGSILFIHGNAENITSHVQSVHWLPAEGWNVFLFDYQGYGKSEGSPTFKNCVEDSEDALKWLRAKDERPLVLLGQSLGAAMAVNVASKPENRALLKTAIIDSGFSSFRGVFRDKLNEFWLTWPLQYPLSIFVSGGYEPLAQIPLLKGLPLIFIHGQMDEIVPPYHSDLMFAAAFPPKDIWKSEIANHIQMLHMPEFRNKLLAYLDSLAPAAQAAVK